MLKKHRIYHAHFEIEEQQKDGTWKKENVIDIENPITCYIDINLDASGHANSGLFQFINLSETTRKLLWRDVYSTNKRITIDFYAGYGYPDNGNFFRPLIFSGEIFQCTSSKSGSSTDWITEIQAWEGGRLYEYGFANVTIAKNTSFTDLVNYLLQNNTKIDIGYITPDIKKNPRNKTFIGQIMDLLNREYGGYEIFINKGKLNVLNNNDVLPGEILTITDETGLLGTPKRANEYFVVNLIFEPRINVGQAISIISNNLPEFNQAYKIYSVKHRGVISERINESLYTEITLALLPSTDINELKPATPTVYTGQATSKWDKPLLNYKVTSKFGWRLHPIKKTKIFHYGIDLGAPEGEPIYAPADGKVTFVGWEGEHGNTVNLSNGKIDNKNITSKFSHLLSWTVAQGQDVYKGQTILGYVGSTGYDSLGKSTSTGPHLHLEIRENGSVIDPSKYIGGL